ncbi:MAG: hypothetical protein WAL25_02860 [Acidimicrobiia bacterium]
MNKVEATELAGTTVDALRALPYRELVDRYLDSSEHREVLGGSCVSYQIEIQALWDTGEPGNLRVLVSIDDGGWRAWSPLLFGFLKAPDGSFVGE